MLCLCSEDRKDHGDRGGRGAHGPGRGDRGRRESIERIPRPMHALNVKTYVRDGLESHNLMGQRADHQPRTRFLMLNRMTAGLLVPA